MKNFSNRLIFSIRFKNNHLPFSALAYYPVQSGRQVRKAPRRRRLWWRPESSAEEDEGL